MTIKKTNNTVTELVRELIIILNKYKILKAVASNSNITKTAEQIHLSQPAISHAIKSLEKEWGFPIFHRVKTGMKTTENGEYLLNIINEILNLNERLNQEVQLIRGIKQGKVRVGTFPSVTTKWIPKIINKMSKEYPGIEIMIIEENYEEIQKLVLNGSLDCGFISDEPEFSSLNFVSILNDPFHCIINRNRESAKFEKFPIQLLESSPFIIPGKGGAVELYKFFKKHNVFPDIRYEIMDINQSIISMVQNDLGISILPNLLISDLPPDVLTKELDVDFYRTIGIVYLDNPSPATRLFIEQIKVFQNI